MSSHNSNSSSDSIDSRAPSSCTCLNVRVHAQITGSQRSSLEDIDNVLECILDSEAIQVELSALFEVKPASSIDPNISVVRCLLCKQPVLYFKTALLPSAPSTHHHHNHQHQQHGQRQLPPAHSAAYLATETKDPAAVRASKKMKEYSEPFGVLLLPAFTGGASSGARGALHVPREIQQKQSEYMQRSEAAKNERVHEYVRTQDQALERIRRRTANESGVISEIIGRVNSQSGGNGTAATLREAGGSSGLAAMLRGRAHSNVGSLPAPPIGSSSGLSASFLAHPGPVEDADSPFDLDETDSPYGDEDSVGRHRSPYGRGMQSAPAPAFMRRATDGMHTLSHQSDEFSDDVEYGESAFGNFDSGRTIHQAAADYMSLRRGAGIGGGEPSSLGHGMLPGSVPVDIPTFGGGSLLGGHSLSRREYQQRADEAAMSRRREQITRDIPSSFMPPHQLMDRIHATDTSDLLIGSKPRESHTIGRRHAPG